MDTILSHTNRLSQYRVRRGWSQAALAEHSGVARTHISAIETDRLVPSVAVAIKLASALGESVEALFSAAAPERQVPWAWAPPADDTRVWRATINGRLVAYPVESTAAGTIPHDGTMTPGGLDVVGPDVRPDSTLVIAGCDPLVGFLVQEMAGRHGVRVIPLLRSSGEALDLLQRGLVHAAGVHLTDDRGETANDRVVKARLGTGHTLVHQIQWDAGIAVGSARRERTPQTLLDAKVRWVNREEGSAAREAFDRLLGAAPRPRGYRQVVHDHRAVATAIAGGWAEVGVCVRPAAAEARLGFIPMHREAYELCIADTAVDEPRLTALVSTLRSRRYRQLLGDVPGCVSTGTGEQRSVA